MARFTIRRKGQIFGTYSGIKEGEALDNYAKDYGFKDFEHLCESLGVSRDDHTVTKVEN